MYNKLKILIKCSFNMSFSSLSSSFLFWFLGYCNRGKHTSVLDEQLEFMVKILLDCDAHDRNVVTTVMLVF